MRLVWLARSATNTATTPIAHAGAGPSSVRASAYGADALSIQPLPLVAANDSAATAKTSSPITSDPGPQPALRDVATAGPPAPAHATAEPAMTSRGYGGLI